LLPTLFVCAVVSLSIASMESADIANLAESAEVVHGGAELHHAPKVHAEVTTSAKVAAGEVKKAAAKLSARSTVMIGTHELDSEEVSMAKAKLHKIVQKIGARHPTFIGATASVSSLVEEGTKSGYVAGGYARLKTILLKVDEFERELAKEHQDKQNEREREIERCNKNAAELAAGVEKFDEDSKANVEEAKQSLDGINDRMRKIEESKAREWGIGMEVEMKKQVAAAKNAYDKYWAETEERHQVRNVLMQALWLVCVGFRSFRHTAYCTTLRKQPDYQETGDSKWVDESGNDYQANRANSIKFGETMTPVWEQQKVADNEAANQLDGDADMEKGFVNNRAPWGVDPASSGGEEKEMTAEQMSSRLSFLIETSYTPERISSPISGFISALQTGDEATQRSLVEALVNIDREEGQKQSQIDAAWYEDMVAGIKATSLATDNQFAERKVQGDLHREITEEHARRVEAQKTNTEVERAMERAVKQGHIDKATCGYNLVEIEAILEVNEEELVNIMRLNSLLRFLVIGEKPSCSDCKDENKGSCTWVTRGAEAKGPDAEKVGKNCKNLEGEAVECNYADSGHDDHYGQRSEVFCACEYGYYGQSTRASPTMGVPLPQNCDKMKCPGYGRILYPASGTALAVKKYPAIAVCSSRHSEPHGICDSTQGICTQCYRDTKAQKTPENIETAQMTESFPYHGKNRKCEHWMCATREVSMQSNVFFYKPHTSEGLCSGHGRCVDNKYGYMTGRCECEEPWYGQACHMKKCEAAPGVFFVASSPNVCNGKGACLNYVGDDPSTEGARDLGQCKCAERFYGEYCELKRCAGFDMKLVRKGKPDGSCPQGTCDETTGSCRCDAGGIACGRTYEEQCPTGCNFKGCSKDCGKKGRCDRITGECTCNRDVLLNGPTCKSPKRCDEREADWSLSFDKWGWSTCKHGYLLVGLKTDRAGTSDALYNLNTAICAKPCEGDRHEIIPVDKYACYHENWWKKFDTAGGKYCRRNYFVAGLFRSHCNSLYCLEMAKCCQVRKSLWTGCVWKKQVGWTGENNGLRADNNDGFVVGFWRNSKHTLNGITQLRVCTPIWWGLFAPSSERSPRL